MIVTEIKDDESIFQDFILSDDVVTTIEAGYEAWAEIYEGLTMIYSVQLAVNTPVTGYELRIGTTTTSTLFENGHVYYLKVYEQNTTLSYKTYIHEEKLKVKF